MKLIRNVSSEEASRKLEQAASEKFAADEMASSCLCRVSDGYKNYINYNQNRQLYICIGRL